MERERAREAGVFENEPEVRMDVFREADYEDELVSVSKTKKLRELWGNLGNVEENSRKERRLPPVCWGVVGEEGKT